LAFYLRIRGLEIILNEDSVDKMDNKYEFVINIKQMNGQYILPITVQWSHGIYDEDSHTKYRNNHL
jgi:hypothetical protein